jgi:hypothetical protein
MDGRSRASSVGIATGYGLDDIGAGVRVPMGVQEYSLLNIVQTGSETHLTSNPKGTGGIWGVNLTTHLKLTPRSRKDGSIHPLPPYIFMA